MQEGQGQVQVAKAIDTVVEGEGGVAPVSGPEGLGPSIEGDKDK